MEALEVSEAYGAARALLERAEADAARIRLDADRYRRQREQEAELLVAKARRLLAVAEQRAASMGRAQVPPHVPPRAEVPEAPGVIDLTRLDPPDREAAEVVVPTGLDRMLQSAIARAFDGSFHLGR
jgi:hypothetical protein